MDTTYQSRAAQEAEASGYGGPSYWTYLDEAALQAHAYYAQRGEAGLAVAMLTRTLGEALHGNYGD